MNGFEISAPLWLFIAAQILGVFTAWLARLSEGSACQAMGQLAFFAMLSLMGMATIVAMGVGPGLWLACSATLAFMVLTVTCDFRASRDAATW